MTAAGEPARPADRRAEVRRAFEADGLEWDEAWDGVSRLDPEFAEAYRRMRNVPWRGTALSPTFKSLIELTVNAAATHLNTAEILPPCVVRSMPARSPGRSWRCSS